MQKRFLNTFIVLFICSLCFCQNNEEHTKDLIYKADIYADINQYDKALVFYNQALENELKKDNTGNSRILIITKIAYTYELSFRNDEALNYYNEALAIAKKVENDSSKISSLYFQIANIYFIEEKYSTSLKYYFKTLEINKKLKNKNKVALDCMQIGIIYKNLSQYTKALDYLNDALRLFEQYEDIANLAKLYTLLGGTYNYLNEYDKALEYISKKLDLNSRIEFQLRRAKNFNNIGRVYADWGINDEAFENVEKAVQIAEDYGEEDSQLMKYYHNLASLTRELQKDDLALQYYSKAIAINKKSNNIEGVARCLVGIGSIYSDSGNFVEAQVYWNEALQIFERLGEEFSKAGVLNSMSIGYFKFQEYDKSISFLKEAIDIYKKFNAPIELAMNYHNLGTIYFVRNEYSKAILNYEKSISNIEQVRTDVINDKKREYLANKINTYNALTNCYIKINDYENAIATIEKCRAKYLKELILKEADQNNLTSLRTFQNMLPNNTAALIFSDDGQAGKLMFVITNNETKYIQIDLNNLENNCFEKYETEIKLYSASNKKIDLEMNKGAIDFRDSSVDIFYYYRTLLACPDKRNMRNVELIGNNKEKSNSEIAGFISRQLYDLFIEPVKSLLIDKTKLLIMPDGVLNFIPFETLIGKNGSYLIENYDISYVPSISIYKLLNDRIYRQRSYNLIAFGGAIYDTTNNNEVTIVKNKKQLDNIHNQVDSIIQKRGSLKSEYASLGIVALHDLPGSLYEVENLGKLIKDSKILTKKDASENMLKSLSDNDELSNYKVIHFATHGIVVPEIPELSAVILSQLKVEENKEDGFLNMSEIINLKLKADLVNLSACETGLGMNYGGEGLVGLTHAFFIAGANSVSASLWQVEDKSTALFMIELYKIVNNNGKTYSEAIADTKRKFISGDFGVEYKNPFYWAPFVYYGKF